jgi:penicillin-binding protein 1A
MNDPEFKMYHGRFVKPSDSDITDDMYECSSYYIHRVDTMETDSLDMIDEELLFDEDGNPIIPQKPLDPNDIQIPTDEHKVNKPTEQSHEETVTFDDI